MYSCGEKTEEYRDITDYWVRRLLNIRRDFDYDFAAYEDCISMLKDEKDRRHGLKCMEATFKQFGDVCFHLGYTNITMTFEFKGISIGKGNPAWGAEPDKLYFVIKLGKRL